MINFNTIVKSKRSIHNGANAMFELKFIYENPQK